MTYSVDVSEYQPAVDDTYPHRWFSFRVCDGDYLDHNAAQNLAWAVKARAAGKLINFTVYVVYWPGMNGTILANLTHFGVPTDCVIMVDVESWGGQIRGDHSPEITGLASALRTRQGGRADLVWCYANRGDFANVYRRRPKWLTLVVASYGSKQPSNPGPGPLAGWQYTDGSAGNPTPAGWPTSSAPFGHCDHNIIYATPAPTDSGELTMDAQVQARFDRLDADFRSLTTRLSALFAVDTTGDGKPDVTGTVQGATSYALAPTLALVDQLGSNVARVQAELTKLAADVAALKSSGAVSVQHAEIPATLTIGGKA